jgi:hypothetical protein
MPVALPNVSIMDVANYHRVFDRQFPGKIRKFLEYEVVLWQRVPWIAIRIYQRVSHGSWSDWEERELVGSAPLLPKPRRFEHQLVYYATIDPELIAYTLLRL